jgi:transposase
MNVYLGIDWSQLKHDLCWMNEAGAVVAQQTVLHSADGFARLDDARHRLGVAPEACLVGIETAHSLLIDFLWARGYSQLFVLPPGMINGTRGRFRQSGAKSDASDARLIADVLRTDRARLMAWHPDGPLVQQMRAKVGLMLYLKRNIVRWTNRLRAVLLRYYPAATEVFGALTAQIALHFVQEFPTPQAAAGLSWEDFAAFARRHHYTNMQRLPDRFARLQRPRPAPNPAACAAYQAEVVHLARLSLELVRTEHREQSALTALFEQHRDAALFRSLPGLGAFLAPAILTKFGEDRGRFPSASKLQALAGTCPVTKSSGRHHSVHFRAACDHAFRWLAQQWAVASVISVKSPWAVAYWHAVRAHGHSDSHAYRCVANRWLAVAWKVWQSRQPYDEAMHFKHTLERSKPQLVTQA